MSQLKEKIQLVVIGHEGSGKSTVVGHLLYKSGAISENLLKQYEIENKNLSLKSSKYSWIIEQLRKDYIINPRGYAPLTRISQGNAVQVVSEDEGPELVVSWNIETPRKTIIMADVPGSPELLRNMITGASQANAALLIVSAIQSELEEGFSETGQAKEHMLLAHHLGIKEMIVGINKMDQCDWSLSAYERAVSKTKDAIFELGLPQDGLQFVPISGALGENLDVGSTVSWWQKKTLLDALDSLTVIMCRDLPFRLAVQDVYSIPDLGPLLVGRVESGRVCIGDTALLAPSQQRGQVTRIERNQTEVSEAEAGDRIGLHIMGVSGARRGTVCSLIGSSPLFPVRKFRARVAILPKSRNFLKPDQTYHLDAHTLNVPCAVSWPSPPIQTVSEIIVTPLREIGLDLFSSCPGLGRFAIRLNRNTVAVGLVVELIPPSV